MGQITDRYVISLKGSPRREAFFSQPGVADFVVWDAFDGRTGAGRDRFDVIAFERRAGRPPEGGEIGCALSHAGLLAEFAAGAGHPDDLMLVAEDDVVFTPDFEAVLGRVARTHGWDWALLAQPLEDPFQDPFWAKNRDRAPQSLLAKPVGPPSSPWRYRLGNWDGELWGTGLYLVTREAARALTHHAAQEGLSWVADDYVTWHAAAGVKVWILLPTIAGWVGESEINATTRPHLQIQSYAAHPMGRQAWSRRVSRFCAGARIAWKEMRGDTRPWAS